MASRVARLFCTSVLLFHCTEVLCAPATQSVTQFMKQDLANCTLPTFLYDTGFMKECSSVNLPRNDLSMTYGNMNVFLCMGAYDAFYNLCQYSKQWQSPFNSTAMFDAYVKKLQPGKEKGYKEEFCKNMKNVTAVSEKTKPLVNQLTKFLNTKCTSLCFELDENFNPLCALIAGMKEITKTVKSGLAAKNNPGQQLEQNVKDVIAEDIVVEVPIGAEKEKSVEEKQPAMKSENKEDTDSAKQHKDLTTSVANPSNITSVKNDNVANTNKPAEHTPKVQDTHVSKVKSDPAPDAEKAKEAAIADYTDRKHDESQVDVPENMDNTEIGKTETDSKASNEDAKTSTISEHTQDTEFTHDQEYNRGPYDPDSDVEQPDGNDQNMPEPSEQREVIPQYHSIRPEEESHFFTYFMVVSLVCIAGYIGYHNKQKVLAIVLEGRRSRNNRGRRRPSTASYRKLDCTLEEAVTSQCNANVTHVIY